MMMMMIFQLKALKVWVMEKMMMTMMIFSIL